MNIQLTMLTELSTVGVLKSVKSVAMSVVFKFFWCEKTLKSSRVHHLLGKINLARVRCLTSHL